MGEHGLFLWHCHLWPRCSPTQAIIWLASSQHSGLKIWSTERPHYATSPALCQPHSIPLSHFICIWTSSLSRMEMPWKEEPCLSCLLSCSQLGRGLHRRVKDSGFYHFEVTDEGAFLLITIFQALKHSKDSIMTYLRMNEKKGHFNEMFGRGEARFLEGWLMTRKERMNTLNLNELFSNFLKHNLVENRHT